MSKDGQCTKWRRNIAENFNRLSGVHERYRRQTDGRQHIANVNVISRSLKTKNLQLTQSKRNLFAERDSNRKGLHHYHHDNEEEDSIHTIPTSAGI